MADKTPVPPRLDSTQPTEQIHRRGKFPPCEQRLPTQEAAPAEDCRVGLNSDKEIRSSQRDNVCLPPGCSTQRLVCSTGPSVLDLQRVV